MKEEKDKLKKFPNLSGQAGNANLQQSELLKTVLESLTHPFYVINARNYTVEIANPAAKFSDAEGMATCYALAHKNNKPCNTKEHPCPLEIIKKTKKPVTVEHIHYDKAGNARNIEVHGFPIFDGQGNVSRIIEYCLDTTERKQVEEALREARSELEQKVKERTSELQKANEQLRKKIEDLERAEQALSKAEQRYRTVAEFTYDWEYWESPDGSLQYVSSSCERITGYKADEFIARPQLFEEITLPEDKSIWEKHHHDAFERSKSEEIQFRIQRRDGQIRWIEHACQPVLDSKGKFLGFRASNRDITQRKQTEEALRKSESALRKSQDELRFLTGKLMSAQEEERRLLAREMHDDLTQRLALLAIEAGKLEQQLGSQPQHLQDKTRQLKEQIIELSANVHDISRQLHPSIIDDLGLVNAIKSECASFSKREGISIQYEPTNIPDAIPKDIALCIYRIMQESLRNIAKHAKIKQAEVSLVSQDGGIYLCIRDNGVGFDLAAAQNKAGLGLASMKERVRLIQGEISIQSRPGEGTVVELRVQLSGRPK